MNFLFPIRRLDPENAAAALQTLLPGATQVTALEFEYTGQDEADATGPRPCTEWLGEPATGRRGSNRTSIDAAVWWSDSGGSSHLTLVEWKYTERNYGTCSAARGHKTECQQVVANGRDPAQLCYLAKPARNPGRHYWQHLAGAGIDMERLAVVNGCPFRGPFYQLMRQFLVAQFLRDQGAADHVDVMSVDFAGNAALRRLPAGLKKLRPYANASVAEAWNQALDGTVPPLSTHTAETLMVGYDNWGGADPNWRAYIRERYGL